MYPSDRKYTKEHEWVRIQGDDATVGITDYAQGQMGEIVFVDLCPVGRQVKQGDVFGSVESAKAVAELFAPLSGEVIAVNTVLGGHPASINAQPHDAWMIRLRPSAPAEADGLMASTAYSDIVISQLGWRSDKPDAEPGA